MPATDKLPPKIIDAHSHAWTEDEPSVHVARMDEANIEFSLAMGASIMPHSNVLKYIHAYPDRFIGGAFIDPRDADALDQIANAYQEGCRIVKLFPNFGYYPDDDAFIPFFAKITELNMGVLSHCGWLAPGAGVTAAYFSHPGRFEKVIRRFTDTPFIMAHMGGIASFLEGIMLTTRTPNTYVDCSPGQGIWVLRHAGEMVKSIPVEKLLWGADSHFVSEQRDDAADALDAIGLGEHFEKIFYSNARGIFEKIGAIQPAGE